MDLVPRLVELAPPVRVVAPAGQDLRLALDVLAFDELDLELQILGLEGSGADITIDIQTGMQIHSSTGWSTIATYSRMSALGSESMTLTGFLRYVRWRASSLNGTAVTFMITGIGRSWSRRCGNPARLGPDSRVTYARDPSVLLLPSADQWPCFCPHGTDEGEHLHKSDGTERLRSRDDSSRIRLLPGTRPRAPNRQLPKIHDGFHPKQHIFVDPCLSELAQVSDLLNEQKGLELDVEDLQAELQGGAPNKASLVSRIKKAQIRIAQIKAEIKKARAAYDDCVGELHGFLTDRHSNSNFSSSGMCLNILSAPNPQLVTGEYICGGNGTMHFVFHPPWGATFSLWGWGSTPIPVPSISNILDQFVTQTETAEGTWNPYTFSAQVTTKFTLTSTRVGAQGSHGVAQLKGFIAVPNDGYIDANFVLEGTCALTGGDLAGAVVRLEIDGYLYPRPWCAQCWL